MAIKIKNNPMQREYWTRTDFVPKISDRVPSSKMTGSVWLRYAPAEPRWSDLMDIRTDY